MVFEDTLSRCACGGVPSQRHSKFDRGGEAPAEPVPLFLDQIEAGRPRRDGGRLRDTATEAIGRGLQSVIATPFPTLREASMADRMDRVANLAVIVMCATVTGVAAWNVLTSRPASAPRPMPYLEGERVEFTEAQFGSSDRTLLLVLSSTCPICTSSLPFYRNVINTVDRSKASVRIVTVVLDPLEEGTKYLSDNGITPHAVIRMPAAAWRRIRHTPTVLLIDRKGLLVDSWVGLLSPEQEKEVLEKLVGVPLK